MRSTPTSLRPFQICHHAGVHPYRKSRSVADATARIFGAPGTVSVWRRGVSALLAARALVGAAPGENGRERPGQDRDVEPDRPVLDVVEVEPHEVVEAQVDPARDLPEARHPRQHEITLPVPWLQLLVVADR